MGRVTDLQERYRSPRATTRVVALVLIVALVVSGMSFLAWAVLFHGSPKVTSDLATWDIRDDHVVFAYLSVDRESQYVEASCRLRAIAADHSVVGEVTVPVTDGPAQQSMEVEIRTERRATTVERIGCTAPDQPRPR
jgi:uncharacterized membrane protein YdbT with pleckstrin-like domain